MGNANAVGRLILWLCLAVSTAAFADEHDLGPRLVQEEVRIPAPGGYTIAATILRPAGEGRYGAVVLNHGTPGSASGRARESSELLIHSAAVFARRGYVVVMPMRRGFGATGGEFAEDPGTCANPDYRKGERNAADDVMVDYDFARTLPYVDNQRMILAGQSAGGIVSMVAAGTRNPQGLVAVLSFAAGRGGNPDFRPGVPCAIEPVAKLLESVGKTVTVPVLLHYAANDLYFNEQTSRLWYQRFTAAGARAEYVLQPPFGRDGHYIFSEVLGVRYWLPAVEQFLGKYNIPFERLDAAEPIIAVDRLPHVSSDACRNLYRVFLESPAPRAYAVSGDGRCGFAGGLADAADVAVRECKTNAKEACSLYAVDADVVWAPDGKGTIYAGGK
ncbi:MAG TPA: prolyl oligopeptidase family serine peptidase [Burkholderiales bacterium]|nr:prolyl oligopeptidase family serine peptidase [Burkholderiales bacterium]